MKTLGVVDVLDVVEEFHEALNKADTRELEKLSADDIVLAGPRGEGRGRNLLEPWLVQSGMRWRPLRWFYGGDRTVVVEQLARWNRPAVPRVPGPIEETVASAFIIADGRVVRCERFIDLPSALSAMGLTLSHEIEPPPPPL